MSVSLPPGLHYVVLVNKGEGGILNASGKKGNVTLRNRPNQCILVSREKKKSLDLNRDLFFFFWNLTCCGFIKTYPREEAATLAPCSHLYHQRNENANTWEGHSPRTQVYKTAVMKVMKK